MFDLGLKERPPASSYSATRSRSARSFSVFGGAAPSLWPPAEPAELCLDLQDRDRGRTSGVEELEAGHSGPAEDAGRFAGVLGFVPADGPELGRACDSSELLGAAEGWLGGVTERDCGRDDLLLLVGVAAFGVRG